MATKIPFGNASADVPIVFTYPPNTTPVAVTGGTVTSSDETIATVTTDDVNVAIALLGKAGDFTVTYAVNGLTASADFIAEAAPDAEPTGVSLDTADMKLTPKADSASSAPTTGGDAAPAASTGTADTTGGGTSTTTGGGTSPAT